MTSMTSQKRKQWSYAEGDEARKRDLMMNHNAAILEFHSHFQTFASQPDSIIFYSPISAKNHVFAS